MYIFRDGKQYPYIRLLIRVADISIIGSYYLIMGIFIAKISEKLLPKFDEEKYKKKKILPYLFELFIYVSIIMVTAYILRKMIRLGYVRFFNGLYGYNNFRVSEARGGVILAFAIITFHTEFQKKLKYFVNERI